MTDDELSAIEAAANAATPGPWLHYSGGEHNVCAKREDDAGYDHIASCDLFLHARGENAAFIAGAREWVPALLAEVRQLREIAQAVALSWDSERACFGGCCLFDCDGHPGDDENWQHTATCPVTQARALLAE